MLRIIVHRIHSSQTEIRSSAMSKRRLVAAVVRKGGKEHIPSIPFAEGRRKNGAVPEYKGHLGKSPFEKGGFRKILSGKGFAMTAFITYKNNLWWAAAFRCLNAFLDQTVWFC